MASGETLKRIRTYYAKMELEMQLWRDTYVCILDAFIFSLFCIHLCNYSDTFAYVEHSTESCGNDCEHAATNAGRCMHVHVFDVVHMNTKMYNELISV